MSSFSPGIDQNVGNSERTLSLLGGAVLAVLALGRAPRALVLAALGGYLIYRGVTAHCSIYDALGITTVGEPHRKHTDHVVDVASEGSFPASDPPGWSTGSAFTQVDE